MEIMSFDVFENVIYYVAVSVSIGSISAVSDLEQDGVRLFRIIQFTTFFCEFQVPIFV